MKNIIIKNTVFTLLSLSTAVSTMGYAADDLSSEEDVPTRHTPEATSLRIDSNRPAPAVTASTVPQPRASDLISSVSSDYLTMPRTSIPCASSTASPIAEDLAETVTAQESAAERRLNLQRRAHGGDARAMNSYACMLDNGQGGEQDLAEARRYFQQAANSGHRGAIYNIATMLYHGRGGEQDYAQARRYFQQTADLGHREAIYSIAVMLYHGRGGPQDLAEARRYYKQAADSGHRGAMYNYALMLRHGQGGEQDLAEARRYYQQAAALGHRGAMNNYAVMLRHGQGGEQDLAEARRYFQQAAALGHRGAMNNYAVMLDNGQGGERDHVKARAYCHLAADRGFIPAMRLMGRKQGANVAAQSVVRDATTRVLPGITASTNTPATATAVRPREEAVSLLRRPAPRLRNATRAMDGQRIMPASAAAQPQSRKNVDTPALRTPASSAAAVRPQRARNRPMGFRHTVLSAAAASHPQNKRNHSTELNASAASAQPQSMRNSGVSALTVLAQVAAEKLSQENTRRRSQNTRPELNRGTE